MIYSKELKLKKFKSELDKYLALYLVTDRSWCQKTTLEYQVEQAIKGGVTCLQVREKNISDEQFIDIARPLQKLAEQYEIPFIINDNIEVCKAMDANGVHVGQEDLDSLKTRELIGNDKILGVSVQNVEQAKDAEQNGADYLGVGAVFSTDTKLDAANLNPQTLKEICEAVTIPVVAIGGINENNIQQLANTSIKGVALVSAILKSHKIENSAHFFSKAVKSMVNNS
jgi:thiamine-phosphate pyrophosphorylase